MNYIRLYIDEVFPFKEENSFHVLNYIGLYIDKNGEPLFELYSTGMALGYSRTDGKTMSVHGGQKLFPRKDRIDKVIENAEITGLYHNGQTYLTESQLYDFMIKAIYI